MFLAFSKNKPKRKMLETATKNFRYSLYRKFFVFRKSHVVNCFMMNFFLKGGFSLSGVQFIKCVGLFFISSVLINNFKTFTSLTLYLLAQTTR